MLTLGNCSTAINTTAEAQEPKPGESRRYVVVGVIPIVHVTGLEPESLDICGTVVRKIIPSLFLRPRPDRPTVRVESP